MNLIVGRKITLVYLFLVISFIAIILLVGHQIWGVNYVKLEQQEVKNNVVRAHLAWEDELDFISSIVEDWAPWDELYHYVNHLDTDRFVEKNLSDSAMDNLRINAVFITDPNGNLLFGKSIDLKNGNAEPISQELIQHISKNVQALSWQLDREPAKGFVSLPNYPALLAMQRIVTSDKKGPSPGVLVFVKYVDNEFIEKLSKRTQVTIGFSQGEVVSANDQGEYQYTKDDDRIKAYFPIRDIYGNRGYYLSSTVEREIFKQGRAQMMNLILFVTVFGFFTIAITLRILDRSILSRIRTVDAFMNSVIKQNDFSVRLNLPGKDELSKVANTMNRMLSQIEQSQGEITNLCKSIQSELEERKKVEHMLRYQSMHDYLTGTYNRLYFEQEIKNIVERQVVGIGIVCCDLDGLKFINDTMGHFVGDQMLMQAGLMIRKFFTEDAVVARIGGDEFAVLAVNIDEDSLTDKCQQMKEELEKTPSTIMDVRLRLSIGWKHFDGPATSEEVIHELQKQADDIMYRNKLSSSHSNRSALVQGMLEMLKVRDFVTEGHSQRMQQNMMFLGEKMGLAEQQMTDLCLLAQFHDIGKVGIPDHILQKAGPLTLQERKEMERHSEIGHRIAQSIPELTPIAEFILKHHEWWNGQGYPLGLKGEEIPIENCILAIVDAYDAMTNQRPYREAMSVEEALQELQRGAGIQFKPELVEAFIQLIKNNRV